MNAKIWIKDEELFRRNRRLFVAMLKLLLDNQDEAERLTDQTESEHCQAEEPLDVAIVELPLSPAASLKVFEACGCHFHMEGALLGS